MLKIAAYVKLYALHNKSGGELYLHHLIKDIMKNIECEVTIFCYDSDTPREINDDNIIEYYDDVKIINLTKDDKTVLNNFDIILTHLDMTAQVCDYCLYKKIKCFLIIHSYLKCHTEYTKNDNIFTIYNAPLIKSEYKNTGHTNNYNCIILPFFNFELYNKYYMYEIEDREYITFVNPQIMKGANVVLKLAKYYPNKKFLIIEGGYYRHKQLLKEFKALPNCHVVKPTDNMLNDIYLKSRIVLQPSDFETWGMVASEAASLGIPVLINKNSNGLTANMGKMCLGGFDSENPEYYIKYIDMLDDKNIYGIYSFFMSNISEKNYNKRLEQLDLLFNNWEKIIKKK